MGIKGRRKKLREREQRAAAAAAADEHDSNSDREEAMDRQEHGHGEAAVVMGNGPYRLPVTSTGQLKMKKSELYRLQDQDYLERIRDEHQKRKQSHLVGQKRQRQEAEKARMAQDMAHAILEQSERMHHTRRSHDAGCGEQHGPRDEDSAVTAGGGVAERRGSGTPTPGNERRTMRPHLTSPPGTESCVGHGDDKTDKNRCDASYTTAAVVSSARPSTASGGVFAHPLLGLDAAVVEALSQSEHMTHMTRIQERSIPYLLQGYDVFGQARTGSGKTLAFGVPLLHQVALTLRQRALPTGTTHTHTHANRSFTTAWGSTSTTTTTLALILTPTKELCVQIHDVMLRLCGAIDLHISTAASSAASSSSSFLSARVPASRLVYLVTGGTKVREERRALALGPMLVIGTPGRVHDHVQHCAEWKLHTLRALVLDEADRMLADGFQRDLDAILAHVPRSRQTSLFSATNSKSVHALARLSLSRTPVFISTREDRPRLLQLDDASVLSAAESEALLLPPYLCFAGPTSACSVKKKKKEDEDVSMTTHTSAEQDANVVRCVDDDDHEYIDNGDADRRSMGSSSAHRSDCDDDAAEECDAEAAVIPSTLRQYCHMVPVEHRLLFLYTFVKRVARDHKAMIFCSTVASTTFHFQMMGSVGFHDDVMMLHGHMKHRQRVQTFRLFRERRTGVLFCTDVAARGLDIPAVDWILQYDPPLDPTEYVHRVGRTARAGGVGHALLLLSPEEAGFVSYVHRFGITLAAYPHAPTRLPRIQEKLEHVLQLDEVVAKSAVAAYRAHVGAYQSHILRDTFDVQRLDCEALARAFALTSAPHVTLPKNSAEEKRREYVKGKLRSLNRRRMDALKHYEAVKTKQQWNNGVFVGMAKPS